MTDSSYSLTLIIKDCQDHKSGCFSFMDSFHLFMNTNPWIFETPTFTPLNFPVTNNTLSKHQMISWGGKNCFVNLLSAAPSGNFSSNLSTWDLDAPAFSVSAWDKKKWFQRNCLLQPWRTQIFTQLCWWISNINSMNHRFFSWILLAHVSSLSTTFMFVNVESLPRLYQVVPLNWLTSRSQTDTENMSLARSQIDQISFNYHHRQKMCWHQQIFRLYLQVGSDKVFCVRNEIGFVTMLTMMQKIIQNMRWLSGCFVALDCDIGWSIALDNTHLLCIHEWLY